MTSAEDPLRAQDLFEDLLTRFPETVRVDCGLASYEWLTTHAEALSIHRNPELPANQVVLLDEVGSHLITVDVTQLPES